MKTLYIIIIAFLLAGCGRFYVAKPAPVPQSYQGENGHEIGVMIHMGKY